MPTPTPERTENYSVTVDRQFNVLYRFQLEFSHITVIVHTFMHQLIHEFRQIMSQIPSVLGLGSGISSLKSML